MPIANSMNLPPELLQFLVSLLAILALAGVARWLRLGSAPRLGSEEEAKFAAGEAVDGFEGQEMVIDASGKSAVLLDGSGSVLLLKLHGNKFAGRLLGAGAWAETCDRGIIVASGEALFGNVTIETEEAETWVERINAIVSASDA